MSDDFPIESRFAIEARVGRGASGEVFRATDRETGLPVAVKRLLSIHDAAALDRFRREARLLSIVEDARLVRYVAHGVDASMQPCLVVEWLVPAAVHFTYAGHPDEATALVAEIDRIVSTAGELDPTVTARIDQLRAVLADRDGDLEAALAHHEASLASFERIGDVRSACLTLSNLGFVRAALGSLPEAEEALVRAGAGAERMGLTTVAALALHNLGGMRASLGRLDEARADEERAVTAFLLGGDPRLEGASRVYLARILLAAGDAVSAEVEARRVAESAASPAPLRAGALAALAETLLAQGRAGEALVAAREAAELLASIKSLEDFEVLIGLAHAESLEACGEPEAARGAASEAWSRLSARGARLTGPTRSRFFGAVPDNARCRALARRWGVAGAEEG